MNHEISVESNRILYTPSVFAKTNLIHLQEAGNLTALMPHTNKRENLASYLFFIIISGEGKLNYNSTIYNLKKGDCVFLDCRKPYSHHTHNNLWQLKWVHFYGPNMSAVYDKYKERGGQPAFHPKDSEKYSSLLSSVYTLASSQDHIRDMKIYEKLVSLLSCIMAENWTLPSSHKSPKKQNLQHIKDYLDQNYNKNLSLDVLSDKFYINKFYLTRIFKEQFGISINNYMTQKKITQAKKLLRFSDLTIEEIANKCGISDSNYFSRVFKKIEHLSPGEYRKLW